MASASVFAEPRWYPPIPNAETSRPVRPSGRLGTAAPDCPCAARLEAPSINTSTKVLRVTSTSVAMLFRGRVWMPAVLCHPDHFSDLDLLHVEWKSMREARLRVVEL